MTKKFIFSLLALTFYFTVTAQSRPDLLDQPALTATAEIKYNAGTATGFLYKGKDSIVYLITAKHVFASKYKSIIAEAKKVRYKFFDSIPLPDGAKVDVKIYFSGHWMNLDAKLYFDIGKDDIAVLKTNLRM